MKDQCDKSIGGTVARYAASKYYQQGLGTITTFLRPKLLSPEYFGMWTLLKMILQYAAYAHLGTQSAMRCLLPLYRSRNEDGYADTLRFTAFTAGLGMNLILAVVALVLAFIPWFSPELRAGFGTVALVVLLHYYHDHLIALLKAEQAFGLVTLSNYVYVTVAFVLTIPLLYFFNIYGLYLSIVLTYAATVLQLQMVCRFRLGLVIDRRALRELLGKGVPMVVMAFTVILITTSDRIIVSAMLGKESLGYYGIAVIVFNFMINLPGTAREVMEPRLMATLEGSAVAEVMAEYFSKPLLSTAYLMPFLVGPVFFALPVAIPLLLPRYTAGVGAAQMLAFGVPFLAMAYVPRILIVAHNWQLPVCWRLPPVLILNLALSIALVKQGYGLTGVAFASSLSFALLLIVLLHFMRGRLGDAMTGWGAFTGWLALPFLVMTVTIFVLHKATALLAINPFVLALLNTMVYVAIMAALFLAVSRRIEMIRIPGRKKRQ